MRILALSNITKFINTFPRIPDLQKSASKHYTPRSNVEKAYVAAVNIFVDTDTVNFIAVNTSDISTTTK